MYISQNGKDDANDYHKITENDYRRSTDCNADTAGEVDYPRLAPGGAGNLCRSQQSGEKLTDAVALLADFAGKICVGPRYKTTHRALFLTGRYAGASARAPLPACRCRRRPGTSHFTDRKPRDWARSGRSDRQFSPYLP